MFEIQSLDLVAAGAILDEDAEIRPLALSHGLDAAGTLLDHRAADGFAPGPYWKNLVQEFHRLICDPEAVEYADIRKKAKKAYSAGQYLGLPVLCGVLATHVRLEEALITPFVALLIDTAAKVGVEAWCKDSAVARTERKGKGKGKA